jgi:uncharacterized damage-inducible protein DinB
MIEGVIAELKSNEDWFYQPQEKTNHAMWIIGHLALADNMFASKFREATANEPAGYKELFWFGSEPCNDQSKYPPVDEVLTYFRERRENLLKVLDDLTDDEMDAAGPPADAGGPLAGAPSLGHFFLFAAYHEGIHTGQMTVCHRGLGNPPMYRPESVPAGDGA